MMDLAGSKLSAEDFGKLSESMPALKKHVQEKAGSGLADKVQAVFESSGPGR